MPIELRCSQCDTLLRVPDGSEGRETRCPSCNVMLRIPGMSASQYPDSRYPDSAAGYPPGSPQQEANPFASPTTGVEGLAAQTFQYPGPSPARLDIGDLFSRAWEIYQRNIGTCLLAGLVFMLLTWFSLIVMYVAIIVGAVTIDAAGGDEVLAIVIAAGMVMAVLFYMLFANWLSIGMARFSLNLARNGTAELGEMFHGGGGLISLFIAYIFVAVASGVGFVFLIVPGFILMLMFSQCLWVIVDRRAGPIESLSVSARITSGHKLTLLLVGLLWFGMIIVASIIPCGIGMILLLPFLMIFAALIYLTLSGQPTVRYMRSAVPTAPAMPPQPGPGANLGGTAPPPDFG